MISDISVRSVSRLNRLLCCCCGAWGPERALSPASLMWLNPRLPCRPNLLDIFDDAVKFRSIFSKFGSTGLTVDPLLVVTMLCSRSCLGDWSGGGSGGCASSLFGGSCRDFSDPVDILLRTESLSLCRCFSLDRKPRFSGLVAGVFLSGGSGRTRLPGVGLEPRMPRFVDELIGVE